MCPAVADVPFLNMLSHAGHPHAQVDEATSTVVLDTTHGCWVTPVGSAGGEDFTRRCRHAVASVGPFVFIYGGLKGSQLLDDLLVSDDSNGGELTIFDPRSPAWQQFMESMHGNAAASRMLEKAAQVGLRARARVPRPAPARGRAPRPREGRRNVPAKAGRTPLISPACAV